MYPLTLFQPLSLEILQTDFGYLIVAKCDKKVVEVSIQSAPTHTLSVDEVLKNFRIQEVVRAVVVFSIFVIIILYVV